MYSNLRNLIAGKLNKSHPELPSSVRSRITDLQFKRLVKKERVNVNRSVTTLTKKYDEQFKFYLLGADSYYYYHLSKKLMDNGRFSEQFNNGKFLDTLMLAPIGCWRNFELHPYVGFYLYKFADLFSNKLTLMNVVSVTPLLIYLLSILTFIYLCSMLEVNRFVTFISGIFLSLAPIFVQRSCLGWYDTDPYNILFPLIVLTMLLKMLNEKFSFFWPIALAAVCSFYALFWQGWIFLAATITVTLLSIVLYEYVTKKEHSSDLKRFLLYTSGIIIFPSLFITPAGLVNSAKEVIDIFSRFLLLDISLWPDIFLTVGELKTPSATKIIHLLGGYAFLIPAFTGVIFLCSGKGLKKHTQEIAILIVCISCLGIAGNAERFVILLLAPASICLAVGLDRISYYLNKLIATFVKSGKQVHGVIINAAIAFILVSPLVYAHSSASQQNPIFNRVWENVLNKIRITTPKNSIINTWWPPGHFIRAIAERGVSFDGATLEMPQSYWMANFFLSDTETEAIGILRMLNSSGNMATEFLLQNGLPLDRSINLIKEVISLNKNDAQKIALKHLSPQNANKFLSMTHSKAPPSYCFIYNDMMESVIGLDYTKNWDFSRAINLKNSPGTISNGKKAFKRGSKENIELMWSISGGRHYTSAEIYQTLKKNNIISFGNSVTLNTTKMEVRINRLEDKISGIPESIIYLKDGKFTEKQLPGANIKLSVLIIKHDRETYSCIVAPRNIARSIIFRLYYLKGAGLERFRLFTIEEDPRLKTKILVYEVLWGDA